MGLSPNPIVSSGQQKVQFTAHARFRMDERDVDSSIIEKVLSSPRAIFEIDAVSGNYVFQAKEYRIVVRKVNDNSFVVLSVFKTNQNPFV